MEEPPVRHMDKDVTSSFVHTPGVPLALSMYAQCPGDRFRTEEPLSSFQTSNNQCGIEESPIEAQPTPSTKSKKITKTFSRKDTDEQFSETNYSLEQNFSQTQIEVQCRQIDNKAKNKRKKKKKLPNIEDSEFEVTESREMSSSNSNSTLSKMYQHSSTEHKLGVLELETDMSHSHYIAKEKDITARETEIPVVTKKQIEVQSSQIDNKAKNKRKSRKKKKLPNIQDFEFEVTEGQGTFIGSCNNTSSKSYTLDIIEPEIDTSPPSQQSLIRNNPEEQLPETSHSLSGLSKKGKNKSTTSVVMSGCGGETSHSELLRQSILYSKLNENGETKSKHETKSQNRVVESRCKTVKKTLAQKIFESKLRDKACRCGLNSSISTSVGARKQEEYDVQANCEEVDNCSSNLRPHHGICMKDRDEDKIDRGWYQPFMSDENKQTLRPSFEQVAISDSVADYCLDLDQLLPEIAVNEECDIMSSLNGKLFSLMEDKNDKVIKMKYVSVTKKKNVPREPEKDVSVTKEREDITAAKKISVTKEEDFSVTKEEYLSASNDEGLSMTKEEDLSVTKKENISVTKEEDLSVTMTKEYLSMTKEEDPSVTKQRECVSAATKGRNDSGKKEKAVSLTEEGGVSRTTPGENVSTTNKKAASVITKANCSMTVMKVDSKNEDEESGAFFSTTKGGNWLLRPFVSLWEEKHFRLALKTEETRNEMKELSSGVGSIMDTINEDNFEDLADEMKELPVTSYVMLSFVCTIFFDRTITERHRMEVFARLCKVMSGLKVPRPPDNDSIKENMCTFRVIVLTKCQKQFEADRSFFADPDTMRRVVEAKFPREDVPNPDEAIETIVDECVLRRKQFHGNVRFIGYLFRLGMLTENIMHDSMYRLLKWRDDDGLKALGNLLSMVGSNLDTDKAKARMNQYFQLITSLLSKISKPSVRFALRNVIELRQNNWKYRTDGRKIEPPEDDQKVYHAYESNWRYQKEGSKIETTEDDQDELKFRSKSERNLCTNDANADNETTSRENLCADDSNAGIGTSS